VKIRSVELRPFRNFDHECFTFEADRTVITGPNGRGKTNILEAISFLSIGRSVRGAQDQQAVPHAGEFFDISASCVVGDHQRHLRLFFSSADGKKAFADHGPLDRVGELLGLLRTVHFAPEDVALVLRFPAQRRRLLDILLSQRSPVYLRALQRYQRVLAQRNALLRRAGHAGDGSLATWTEQLAVVGGFVRQERQDAIAALSGPFGAWMKRLAPDDRRPTIEYRGGTSGGEAQDGMLLEELGRRARQEQEVGYTLCGPHRDDVLFALDERPAPAFASEGQLKCLMIAWKLAEVGFLQLQPGGQPVLLLDDVLSELDEQRGAALMEIVDAFEQVIVTSPRPIAAGAAARFARLDLGG
jgi:DNA replication and repair protein RecF